MKKNSTFKVLGITFLIVVLLSWVIPAGYYSNGSFTSLKDTLAIGLYDLIRVPVLSIATFIQYGILFLAIGGFYGVLNKTSIYSGIVSNIVKKFEKGRNKFLIFTIILFALLTSLTGLNNLMFILVPFFVAILIKLGYSKMTSFTSTVGSILIGNIGTTLGFNFWGYLQYYFQLSMTTLMFARAVLLVMSIALLIIFVIKNSKNDKNKDEKDIPLYKEGKSKKSSLPFIIVTILVLLVIFIGQYNWYYSFKIEFFNSLHENITSFKIGNFAIFSKLLGGLSAFGFLGNYDVTVILILASLLIGWLYNVKMNDIFEGFIDGCKEMLPAAIYSMLSCVVFASLLNMSEGNFIYTIVNKFNQGENFSFMGTVGTSLISSFAYNDFYTMVSNFYSIFSIYDSNVIPIIAFIFQTIYGVVMLIAPTSVYLIAGLTFMDISYKDWAKHIWKYALLLFGIIIVVAFILTTLI